MTPKMKKQYGNAFGPYGPPIYQQPQLPSIPYSNGFGGGGGMNGFSNQLQFPPYYPSNVGDGNSQQQQQLDPASYSYSNGLSYYQPQSFETEVTTGVVPAAAAVAPTTTSDTSSPSKASANKKQGWLCSDRGQADWANFGRVMMMVISLKKWPAWHLR